MPFQIQRLTNNTPVISTNYFLDANVWIYALQYLQSPSTKPWEQMYVDFFDDVINSTLNPNPKILMPSVLASEIINTYLRQVAFEDFKRIPGNANASFKRDFRPTQACLLAYEQILDDLHSYRNSIKYISDAPIISNSPSFLSATQLEVDFNDKFYSHLLLELQKNEPITIVTNDNDFAIENIHILTNNRQLLAL